MSPDYLKMHSLMNKWYLYQDNEITGPYPKQVLLKQYLLGRLSADDKISQDQETWFSIASLQSSMSGEDKDRAKQYLDERNGFDRRTKEDDIYFESKRKQERRLKESPDIISRRQLRTTVHQRFTPQQQKRFWPLTLLFLFLTISISLAFTFPNYLPINNQVNCLTEPAPKINWSNCNKTGVDLRHQRLDLANLRNSQFKASQLMNVSMVNTDLSYANLTMSDLSYSQLRNSKMIGTNLQQADLAYADLSGADLSFADLTGANLGGSKYDDVIFDHAIWLNGQTCMPGSIGHCRLSN